jgi:hypothetical protein
VYTDDLVEAAPITERDNQHDKLILLGSKIDPRHAPLKKVLSKAIIRVDLPLQHPR